MVSESKVREILFRGKNKITEKWVYGSFLHLNVGRDYICDGTIWIGTLQPCKDEVIPKTVGQFTGLTDKAGRKAFEHDVIKHHFGDEIGVIRYGSYRNPFGDDSHGGHVGFYIDWVAGSCPECLRKDLGYWMQVTEIIGNIHDNPELLEVFHV